MSPERINNQHYSYPADIWSLGLTLLECGTGVFPYNADKGPVNLMLQVMEDPSPTPPADQFSAEFRDFVDACLIKDSFKRPTAEQLLSHPFIKKFEDQPDVDLPSFVHSVFDPIERLKDLSDMLAVHYYILFDGQESLWKHMESFYQESSSLSYNGKTYDGAEAIFKCLTSIRKMLKVIDEDEEEEEEEEDFEVDGERLVHTMDNLECCAFGRRGVMVRVSGSLVVGTGFIPPGDSTHTEGMYNNGQYESHGAQKGTFNELFVMEPGEQQGSYWISKQEINLFK
eukprot:TRINITY_DN3253_c0_g1_i1.p1 TRINITY_DN3253_c0_g1~~TRINITY_DN3253_c0_g1_i1.p1  ORF type:complete len:284 (+),score=50.14 TRINITY_DN3253_c0_g1_i1:855-1706(+)